MSNPTAHYMREAARRLKELADMHDWTLDALVHERVIGKPGLPRTRVPAYTADIAHAWRILDDLRTTMYAEQEEPVRVEITREGEVYHARFSVYRGIQAIGHARHEVAARAICEAAVLALGITLEAGEEVIDEPQG